MPAKELPPVPYVIKPISEAIRNQVINVKQRFAEGLKARLADPTVPKRDLLQEAIDSGKIKP